MFIPFPVIDNRCLLDSSSGLLKSDVNFSIWPRWCGTYRDARGKTASS
jgi:hypothetical protein